MQEALCRLMRGRTVLVIAHRLSTVRDAGLIAVMERGRGGHRDRPARRPRGAWRAYARLRRLQLSDDPIRPEGRRPGAQTTP